MSQPVTFEPGTRYVLHGKSYEVIQILDDGMRVAKDLTTNTHISHQLTQLWHHWQAQTLEFARQGANLRTTTETDLPTTYAFANLADLPPRLQDITWHRYQLILPLLHLPSRARTQQVVEHRIQEYCSLLQREHALPTSASLAPFFAITPRTVAGFVAINSVSKTFALWFLPIIDAVPATTAYLLSCNPCCNKLSPKPISPTFVPRSRM